MKKNYLLTILSILFCFAIQAQVNYSGNGNGGFGGTVGGSSLDINDDGTTMTFSFSRGGSNLDNVIVIYVDSKTGGFTDTSSFDDDSAADRIAISTRNSGNGRDPEVTFPAGFTANYAVSIKNDFAGIFELAGTGAHTYIDTADLTPNNNAASATHTFTVDFSQLGITSADKFDYVVTYVSGDCWMSDEVIGDTSSIVAGTGAGVNPGPDGSITFSGSRSYPNTWTGATDNDWATASNWTEGVPTMNHNVYIPNVTNQPTASGAVTINKGIIKSGASVIAQDDFTGTITYEQSIGDTNWHLISSPVVGEQYNDAWVTANSIPLGTLDTSNRGIATYDNSTPDTVDSDGAGTNDSATGYWRYFQGGTDVTFGAGVGYSLKRSAAGNYTFTGTFPTTGVTPAISQDDNNWNLIGNPYPSYFNIATFISDNTANLGAGAFQAIYVWNAGTGDYEDLTTGFLHPGQAFFINSNVASGNATITEAMQSHTAGTFYKNADSSIELMLSNGTSSKRTKINYLDTKTAGLDPGFDIGMFDGVSSDLGVFTNLVNNNEGIAFARQALPNSDLESMVIPVGIIADANKEITFSANASNIPAGLKVFLEDRNTNTFTRLDELNSNYKVTLTETTNGIGRFYLHTKSSALSTETVALENVSMYSADKATLRIVGLSQGKSTIKMFNVLGKQVLNATFNSNGVSDINVSQLSTGVYIVQLENEAGSLNKKVVLE